jgi:hypothetical protein
MLNKWGPENHPLFKEGTQHLYYAISRSSETKLELLLEMFSKQGLPQALRNAIRGYDKMVDGTDINEAAGWACGIIALLAKPAATNRKFESLVKEILEEDFWDPLDDIAESEEEDFIKDNAAECKEALMKLDYAKREHVKMVKRKTEIASKQTEE